MEMMVMMMAMMSSLMTMAMASISPSGREFPRRIPARQRALFSLVFFRPAEAALSILRNSPCLRFSGRRSTRRRGGQRGCGPPPHMAARPGQGPRRPMRGAHGGPPRLLLLATSVFWKNRIFHIISVNCCSSEIWCPDGAFSSRILTPVYNSPMIMKHAK